MQLYLPIAEVSVNAFVLLGIGGFVGVLSSMFGVGGGFLITPLLMFIGIPATVAVATGANHVVASSVSGVLAHLQRRGVDVRMGAVLLAGGIAGSAAGVAVFDALRRAGQTELLVQLSYVVFLGGIGALMLQEGLRSLWRTRRERHAGGVAAPRRAARASLAQRLPLRLRFRASGLYISVLPPLAIGAAVGFLAAIMGVGGGFILVPAMIYLLGMPTRVVIGTSLFQIVFVTAFTTLMHALTARSVDMLLALVLILGGVVGAQVGMRIGLRLRDETLRILLAALILAVAGRIALDLLLTPGELYSLAPGVLP